MVLRRINALICDLVLSYLLMYLCLYLKPSQIPFFSTYFLVLTVYYLVTWLIFKRSLFQLIFRINIRTNTWAYTLIKLLLVGITPMLPLFFYTIQRITLYKLLQWTILYMLILIVSNIIIALITRKSVWQLLAHATVDKECNINNVKQKRYYLLGMIVLIVFAFWDMTVVFTKNKTDSQEDNLLSILSNEKYAVPISYFAKQKYIDDINKTKRDPIKYIFDLFEEKDIVIISERMHPEYTQWQLFSQIILSDEFAAKVGNVCTEFGLINHQQDLEDYMATSFDDEEELKRATACLVRENGGYWPLWSNKNIHDFILNLHKFNYQKDSSQRINLFFSDVAMNWDTITNKQQWNSWGVGRDSIMAEQIMSVYKRLTAENSDRKKILVIENTRHAYKSNTYKLNATADYIFKKFPTQTANVYTNTPAISFIPAKMGLWDAAALQVKDSAWAIDFNECLLGNDYFDMYQEFNLPGKRYKDVFDGMIYYMHPKKFRVVTGYDYMLDNFKDTLLRRSAVLGEDYLEVMKNQIKYYEENNIEDREVPFFKLFNLFYACFHFIVLTFLLINLIVLFVKVMCKKTIIANDA